MKEISCPQCGNSVADTSRDCPNTYRGEHCGFDVNAHVIKKGRRIGVLFLIAGLAYGAFFFYNYNYDDGLLAYLISKLSP